MFQFPGFARAFRDRRSLGSSPGLIAAFRARILMTPRHPPRALRSLTTPLRPPRPEAGRKARPRLAEARLPARVVPDSVAGAASRDAATAEGNDPSGARGVSRRPGPRSIRVTVRGDEDCVVCHDHTTLRLLAIATDHRIVREHGDHRDAPAARPSREVRGPRRSRLAAGQGARPSRGRPRPAPGGGSGGRRPPREGGKRALSVDRACVVGIEPVGGAGVCIAWRRGAEPMRPRGSGVMVGGLGAPG